MTFAIYGLHSGDGAIRYVGQTTISLPRRLTTHRCNARAPKTPSQFWIMKHGIDNIQIELLETAIDKEHLNYLEKFWIAQMRDIGSDLLNVTAGGDGVSGTHHTAESKAAISAKNKGMVRTPEQRKRISDAILSKPRSAKQMAHVNKMHMALAEKRAKAKGTL